MAKEPDSPQEKPRRGFPGGFFLFLLLALLIALTVQNFLTTKHANVSFSYQVQHLVNLELVIPEDSRMTALNDNLVTFSGRFQEKLTDEGKRRYHFLDLLHQQDQLEEKRLLLEEELTGTRKEILAAADLFFHLTGRPLPESGYTIFSWHPLAPEVGSAITLSTLSDRQMVTLHQLESDYAALGSSQLSADSFKKFSNDFKGLVQAFRSPALGIGSEVLKDQLRSIEARLASVAELPAAEQLTAYEPLLRRLQGVVSELGQPVNGVRLSQLRSVRTFKQEISEYEGTLGQIQQLSLQLDRARAEVAAVAWYFDNKELSTRALERVDPESYNHWFQQASQEWEAFPANRGLPFRAIDQPRNLVLERTFKSQAPSPNYFRYLPFILFIGLLLIGLWFVFSRQMRGMGGGAMNFGKSPARLFGAGMTNVTFRDVAGCDEAKEELQEIVEFLKSPSKFTALGGRIPKGVICVGPPGTGKTLIAKAVAGEAGRPFFSISGSDFVEMFVGVGASRIRDLFNQAKKQAPCIIFIDEIDAVGRHRGGGYGGGHDEREQTLNQLLVEMDGFDTSEGVILMAATNRPDVLDRALLRPGRFDRRVVIDLPDINGRLAILKVHARKIKMDPSVDLMAVARMTPGASGADLGNMLNEAALLAARRGRTAVTPADVLEAADKVRYGKERRSLEIGEEEKRHTAYHESGHAIVGLCVKHADPVDKVTIIPRGFSLGATHFLPEKNRLNYWKREVLDHLAVAMGGRIAEEIFVGDMSSGAQQDITQATQLARSMVTEWGMSDKLGLVAYQEHGETGQFLGLPALKDKSYSEATAEEIDEEVRLIIQQAYDRAKKIILDHREEVEEMTARLIEFETLDKEDLQKIMSRTFDPEEKYRKMKMIEHLHKKGEVLSQEPQKKEPTLQGDPPPCLEPQ